MITNYDDFINEHQLKLDVAFNETYNTGLTLHELRREQALDLELSLIDELKDLDLINAKINITFEEIIKEYDALLDNGLDNVDINISLNEGELLKPLSKAASGGERARFMFALKIIYAKQNNLSLLILDEIDIGISGKTAAMVANKMQAVSKDFQLIVISHLPKVASKANNHFGIYKSLVNNRMVTNIKKLTEHERIEIIALMLSGESLSPYAIEQAKMLLDK